MCGDAGAEVGVGEFASFKPDMIARQIDDIDAGIGAKAGNVGALVLQQPLGDLPAAIETANHIGFGDHDVGEEGSQNGEDPEMSLIGRVSTPDVDMSISTKEMPSCFFDVSVRTRQKHQSA